MKRILSVIACFIALIFMSFAITKDEPTYKNLKVLPRNTNKKQMDSIMHHFAVSPYLPICATVAISTSASGFTRPHWMQ